MARALQAYYADIRDHPILGREQEAALAREFRTTRSPAILAQLARANLRLVVKIARQYRWSGQELEDLIAEGNHALVIAIQRFDPTLGVRLMSYASYWIRAFIMRYVVRMRREVRVGTTAKQRRLLALIRCRRAATPAGADAMAREVGLGASEVAGLLRHLAVPEVRLDAPLPGREDLRAGDRLAGDDDPERSAVESEARRHVGAALAKVAEGLGPRDRSILHARWLDGERATLSELGRRFGITRERVRQLERRVLHQIRDALDERIAA
jgi:RNA polymerase sigma-32 factor